MAKFTDEDDALLDALGVVVEPEKVAARTPREERIIAAFEEIQRFVETQGRAPRHGEERDIFERIHAVRLDRIREQQKCRGLVTPLDHQGLLETQSEAEPASPDTMDDDALLAALGVEAGTPDITDLRHVRSSAEKRAAEEVATRQKCEDFEAFRPLFEQIQRELDAGIRETRPLGVKADIEPGRFFIIGGQKAYVAEMGEEFTQNLRRQGCATARDLRQRHREQHAQTLASPSAPQGRGRQTHPGDVGRAAVLGLDRRWGRGERDDLRATKQGGDSLRRAAPRASPQDRRHQRKGGNAHRQRTPRADLPNGGRRNRGRVTSSTTSTEESSRSSSTGSSPRRALRSKSKTGSALPWSHVSGSSYL